MIKPARTDLIVSLFYWPTILVDIGIIIAVPLYLMTQLITERLLLLSTEGVGAFAAIIFILTVFDRDTRRAVDAYNEQARLQANSRPWWRRLTLRIGDRPLQICGLCLWLELVALILTGQKQGELLLFSAFFLTGVILMRTLKTKGSWLNDTRQL